MNQAASDRSPMQIEQLKPIIEAALLASSQPMTVHQLGEMFNDADDVNAENIARALEALGSDCEGRGVELKEVASGFRYQVRQEVHAWISRMWTEKPSRYSRALLETLALIAYRQPITRPEIEQIRGVVVSTNIIKTMEEREWIRVVGYRDVPGKPALFGTTRAFLDYFNLKSLDQLPPLSEIRDMEDPQLRFEQDPLPPRIIRDLSVDPEGDALLLEQAEQAASEDGEIETELAAKDDAEDELDLESSAEVEADAAPAAESAEPTIESAETGELDQHSDALDDPLDDGLSDNKALDPSTPSTADEAANPADVEPDDAKQDTEEYRA
jgi:segregation and condensation protein B